MNDVIITAHRAVRQIWGVGQRIPAGSTGQVWLLDSASQELGVLPANQFNMGLCAEFPRETLLPYLLCTPYCFPSKLIRIGLA